MKEQNYHVRLSEPARVFVRNLMREISMKKRSSERGGILGALLITGVVVVCLMIVGVIVVARSIHVTTNARNGANDVSIDLPGGHLEVRAHDKAGTAIKDFPMYPGAHSTAHNNGGDAVVQWSSNSGKSDKGFSVSASESVTSDPFDKVVDYYRTQLPNWMVTTKRNGHVEFELHNGGYKRVVGIHEEHDGTHIGVASVGEAASN
jgi:hypothetical protein